MSDPTSPNRSNARSAGALPGVSRGVAASDQRSAVWGTRDEACTSTLIAACQ